MSLSEELKNQIKTDLMRHEGIRFEVYLDHLGLATGGIGHLITEEDYEVGDEIPSALVDKWFEADFDTAVSDCCALFLNFESHPDHVKRVLVNMAFNLGRNRLGQFKNMATAVNEGNYPKAAIEMMDSKWYLQVGLRSKELVEMMRG
jgi:lysozyme